MRILTTRMRKRKSQSELQISYQLRREKDALRIKIACLSLELIARFRPDSAVVLYIEYWTTVFGCAVLMCGKARPFRPVGGKTLRLRLKQQREAQPQDKHKSGKAEPFRTSDGVAEEDLPFECE